jgi:4-carboxymuconolactone decarboxylase
MRRNELDESRYEIGMQMRRSVLGDAHVDLAQARTTPFDAPFQQLIVETAWGSVWSRPSLDLRTRSLVTIAVLASLGRHEELAMHVRACANTGATPEEIREALLHVAVYAGIPAANSAFAIAAPIVDDQAGAVKSEQYGKEVDSS